MDSQTARRLGESYRTYDLDVLKHLWKDFLRNFDDLERSEQAASDQGDWKLYAEKNKELDGLSEKMTILKEAIGERERQLQP